MRHNQARFSGTNKDFIRTPYEAQTAKIWQRFTALLFSLRLLTLTGLMGMTTACVAQEPNSQLLTANAPPDYLALLGKAATAGGVIMAIIGIVKAVNEWTAIGRKNKALNRTTQLAALIQATTKMTTSQADASLLSGLRESAELEFMKAAARCYPVKRLPSKIRQLFLLYLPPQPLAIIPHFLFFSLCSLTGIALFAVGDNALDRTADANDLLAIVMIVCVTCLMQRWAALELRKANKIVLPTKHLRFGISWYPANSHWGLLSNSLLIFYGVGLLWSVLSGGASDNSVIFALWPYWQRLVMALVSCALVPIYYLWSRAESMNHSGAIKPLTLRGLGRDAFRLRPLDRFAGLLAFCLATIWCLVLVLDMRLASRIALLPDGVAGTLGLGRAWATLVPTVLFEGVFPWIAIYRGLPDLLDHGRAAAQGVECNG
jgi:hypothetical protein